MIPACRDCHAGNILVDGVDGASASAIVADLSRGGYLPHRDGIRLDQLAVLHLLLVNVLGVSAKKVYNNYSRTVKSHRAEGCFPHIWNVHRATVRDWVHATVTDEALEHPGFLKALYASTVMIRGLGMDLCQVRALLDPGDVAPAHRIARIELVKSCFAALHLTIPARTTVTSARKSVDLAD
jgi:hypothetical protein